MIKKTSMSHRGRKPRYKPIFSKKVTDFRALASLAPELTVTVDSSDSRVPNLFV